MTAMVILLLDILLVFLSNVVESTTNISLPGCPDRCGDILIPYPFGIGDNCSLTTDFNVTCKGSDDDGTPTPYLYNYFFEILYVDVALSQARVNYFISSQCYNATTKREEQNTSIADCSRTPFWLNNEKNKLTVTGCNTFAKLTLDNYTGYSVGCLSTCNSEDSLYTYGSSCSGIGCCQTAIPKGTNYFSFEFDDGYNHSTIYNFSHCSYAMVVEDQGFMFNTTSITTNNFLTGKRMPVVFDWSIGKTTCQDAQTNNRSASLACRSAHSGCSDYKNGVGYICNCSEGYEGSPYLDEGCQDIDECAIPNQCPKPGKCHNLPGTYRCICPFGWRSDNDHTRECKLNLPLIIGLTMALGFTTSIIILLLYIAIAKHIKLFEKRKQERLKYKCFIQNRGLLLQQLITSHEDTTQKMRNFRLDELEKATNKFDSALIIGKGGHGEVYKGILSDQRVVAIKRSKIVDQFEIDQFINEVVILSQINHRNVVKLFGCCLETEVPLLVYEFVSNGTLYNHLHGVEHCLLLWKQRLRVALEAAGAISYLHSSASISVFHRDIKSSNILLDDYFTAKVSDFGTSRSVQIDQTGITTAIQGTYGYLDPEYYYTGRLTQKSDVYSFGVILVELLTRKKPLFSTKMFEGGSLIAYFSSAMKENRLFEILDPKVANHEDNKKELEAVAKLAEMCLRMRGEDRPTMKEVEVRLEVLWRSNQQHNHPWTSDQNMEGRELVLLDYNNAGVDITQKYSLEQEQQSSSYFPR